MNSCRRVHFLHYTTGTSLRILSINLFHSFRIFWTFDQFILSAKIIACAHTRTYIYAHKCTHVIHFHIHIRIGMFNLTQAHKHTDTHTPWPTNPYAHTDMLTLAKYTHTYIYMHRYTYLIKIYTAVWSTLIRTHAHTHTHTHTHKRTRIYILTHTHMAILVSISIYTRVHLSAPKCKGGYSFTSRGFHETGISLFIVVWNVIVRMI